VRHLLMVFFLLMVAAPAAAAPRVALVVGNGAYSHVSPLPNPPNDARAVAAALRDLGFDVLEALDLDQSGMRRVLGDFAARLDGSEVGLFFYAGHGLQVAGRNYLLPVDTALEREADIYVSLTALDDVLRVMEAAVPVRLVLLDACRDNPFAGPLARAMGATRGAAVGNGLAKIDAATGTLLAYATAPDAVALDGQGSHSPFAAALLEYIADPRLEVRQMLTRVRASVVAETEGRQVPWDTSSLTGDLYLTLRIEIEPPTAPSTDPMRADLMFWETIKDSTRAEDFNAYLARFGDAGVFTSLARSRLRAASPTIVRGMARVTDGDGLEIGTDTVRLASIDAPEDGQTCTKDGQEFDCSDQATAAMIALVEDTEVVCEGNVRRDRHGRLVAICKIGGRDLGEKMVETGWAIARRGSYKEVERVARDAGRGLWAGTFEAPWEWQQRRKAAGAGGN